MKLQCDGKENPHKVKFYVVDVNSQSILGLRDYEKLGLITRMDIIHTGQLTKVSIKELYRSVLQCLAPL